MEVAKIRPLHGIAALHQERKEEVESAHSRAVPPASPPMGMPARHPNGDARAGRCLESFLERPRAASCELELDLGLADYSQSKVTRVLRSLAWADALSNLATCFQTSSARIPGGNGSACRSRVLEAAGPGSKSNMSQSGPPYSSLPTRGDWSKK